MSRCQSCRTPIVWARTQAGKNMPLEPVGQERPGLRKGRFELENGQAIPIPHVGDQAPVFETPLFVSHFASCPNAAHHRKAVSS